MGQVWFNFHTEFHHRAHDNWDSKTHPAYSVMTKACQSAGQQPQQFPLATRQRRAAASAISAHCSPQWAYHCSSSSSGKTILSVNLFHNPARSVFFLNLFAL